MIFIIFFTSLLISLFSFFLLIPRLKDAGITGKDMHKPDTPEISEMGGVCIIIGFSAGVLLAIAFESFTGKIWDKNPDIQSLFAVLSMVLLIGLIGIIDDLIHIKQSIKAITPFFAAMPLAAIKAGYTILKFPFLGSVDFGIIYPLMIIPLSVTIASNAVNMLAGFNGLEAGMGLVINIALVAIAYFIQQNITATIILIASIGALTAALIFNWYPAKVFVGDAGTLTIGAIIASAIIIGNFETAGVFIIIPYCIDFLIKAINKFPSKGWWGIYNNGKLHCPASGPVGLAQLIMKIKGGIKETNLVLILIAFEALCGACAVLYYLPLK